jgi:hypothetical protein
VEQVALTRLYVDNVATWYGPLVRGDEYWRWLVGRRGYERLYIAIEGPDKFELDDRLDSIVGYAVMRQGRLLEMMTSQRCPHARAQLLARACGDAIEQDQTIIRVDAPCDDPLHPLIVAAGGTHRHHEVDNGEVFLANLRDPWGYLSSIRQDLIQRVRRAHAERPGELGLLVDGEKYRLIVGQRDVKLIPGKLGRSYLECSAAQFSQLLLGQHDPKEAVAAGRITASTSIASEWGSILFPKLPLWIPPWDDMPA